jgi:hypothetical protein
MYIRCRGDSCAEERRLPGSKGAVSKPWVAAIRLCDARRHSDIKS